MINKVILVGNIGADPEIRTLESGVKTARVRLATTERFFNRQTNESTEQTEWHTVIFWRGLAVRYMSRAQSTIVIGRVLMVSATSQPRLLHPTSSSLVVVPRVELLHSSTHSSRSLRLRSMLVSRSLSTQLRSTQPLHRLQCLQHLLRRQWLRMTICRSKSV